MNRSIAPPMLASLCLLAGPIMVPAQVSGGKTPGHAAEAPSNADAALLRKKATEAQARIRGSEGDSGELKKAVKINDIPLAKEILIRNGFTAKDLENAKIILRTGGGRGGEDTIEISVACCDPKEITIQRTLENFTK